MHLARLAGQLDCAGSGECLIALRRGRSESNHRLVVRMPDVALVSLVAWLAGFAAAIGAALAQLEGSAETDRKQEFVHGVVAFGGGILLAAVAFALTPEGIERLSPLWLGLSFCAGGLVFCGVDALITRYAGNKSNLMAMLLDFVPEAIALGAVFGQSRSAGMLLALFIGAQNLPEGLNAHRENTQSGTSSRHSLLALTAVSLLGPMAAVAGHLWLADSMALTAGIMSFAAGGILYLVFQDIAPQATMQQRWKPPLGAVLGFAVGMLGHQWLA